MRGWLLLAAAIFVVGLLFLSQGVDEFLDYDMALTQRQQQQFEGENRYNDLARVQNPRAKVNNDQVRDALEQTLPATTNQTASLLTLFRDVGLGAAAPPSGGTSVEQTGAIQEKINFCESIKTIDCNMLNDPRMAECGFCHRDGTDSNGRPHRGGMFISSDDQIRANEAAGGDRAIYKPTVGQCRQVDFTLTTDNCEARERYLECQRAGAATSANNCGQCYGAAPAGSTGLLYMGAKPKVYMATLHVSHPGMHSAGGRGLVVRTPRGEVTLTYSNVPLLDPREVTLELAEGDHISLSLSGVPPIWGAWLSSPDGRRNVSLDIGVDSISPANGFTIAGDKRSTLVRKTFQNSAAWPAFQAALPNTVLMYRRRDEVVPGAIVRAWYGNTPSDQGVDVTDYVKAAAGENRSFPVTNDFFHNDPAPGIQKHIWVTHDNGRTDIATEGQAIDAARIYNNMSMDITVPATLAEPYYEVDKGWCPSGPMVLTAEGAGRMGANSCFKIDGSFNPSVFCIQQLWNGAGADAKGRLYPKTADQAKALAKDTLDATMDMFNNAVNIGMYGVDMNGAPQDFETIRQYALDYFGVEMHNPCDGPTAQTGPHTKECLDYLLRTSGNPSQDGTVVDRKKLPYAYCTTDGWTAPIDSNGNANIGRITYYNSLGAIPNVRAAMQGIYNSAHDNRDFPAQKWAMKACYGVNLDAPQEDSATCPPPNSEEWQCFPVDKIPRDVVDPNYVPAFRFDRSVGDVVGMSSTGGAIHTFPSTDACIAWTKGPKNNPTPNGVNRDQPFLTRGYAREYIRGRI